MITLAELIKNPNRIGELRLGGQTRCGYLVRDISYGWIPSDESYDQMSDMIEKFPPACGRVRRG